MLKRPKELKSTIQDIVLNATTTETQLSKISTARAELTANRGFQKFEKDDAFPFYKKYDVKYGKERRANEGVHLQTLARLDHQLAWNPPRIPLTHHMTLLVKITEERKDL